MLLGAAAAARDASGSAVPPYEAEEHGKTLLGVRQALGEEAFATAWAQGEAMTLDEVVV